MKYCVDYMFPIRGTIYVDATSEEEEAEATVKKMFDTDFEKLYLDSDDYYEDYEDFEVVDVQPEYEDEEEN